ncbi:MAG: flavodoxin-dependent (E)-4-hydroxy-3-methylbut-2-enyl-diphosphate synthase, partial [Candidatus Omnitrophica bacterium]|nr:flavodoxin-dependent (E)-4-hydroxy-3-methylbut-2-enyl-diphosphate synthase [Candidatus Omnitrophota bacterium]
MIIKRRKTRMVKIGDVKIGAGYPIAIQSMTKVKTADISSTVKEINDLEKAGCEIVRLAVKDALDAKAIKHIKKETRIPIVADIHFDHNLAVSSIYSGADKIRINPGNMRKKEDIVRVIDCAAEKKMPIRIGVNSGSLPFREVPAGREAEYMVKALLKYLKIFEERKFNNIVISLKSSSVLETIASYRKASSVCDYPFHLGITASGVVRSGIIKSAIGMGTLLLDGIGDTIRVSLTADACEEVDAAKRILSSLELRHFGPEIISCPTCVRCQVDLIPIVEKLEKEVARHTAYDIRYTNKPLLIAIMGCEVNG